MSESTLYSMEFTERQLRLILECLDTVDTDQQDGVWRATRADVCMTLVSAEAKPNVHIPFTPAA